MKYNYQEIYDKKIFNRPIWACNYEFDIVKWGKEMTQEPIQGEIKEMGMGGLVFTPYAKQENKKKNKSHSIIFTVYQYADTKEECDELYIEILRNKIGWCKDTISELEEIIENRKLK